MMTTAQLLQELAERFEHQIDQKVDARAENTDEQIEDLRAAQGAWIEKIERETRERLGAIDEYQQALESRISALERSMNGHGTSYGDSAGISDRVSRLERMLGQ